MNKRTRCALVLGVIASLALAACEEGGFGTGTSIDGSPAVRPPAERRVEIVEVERPDVFSATELALWDGRPSLGGIWVAHPDVNDPERVRITNTGSGQSVNGALFRRERQNPGPRIQLSSDAAAALGVLAGQPTELSVVVLRQEEVVIEPELAPVEEPTNEEATGSDDGVTESAVAAAAATASVAPPKKRPGFWDSVRAAFGGNPEADSPELAEDGEAETTASTAPEVETQTLDPIDAAAAAIDEAEANQAQTAIAAAPAAAPSTTGSLRNPYIQVGLYSQEANANSAAAALRQGGIVPTVVPGSNANGPFWRVIVGPVTTADDQAEILGQVRSLGYSDAFLAPR